MKLGKLPATEDPRDLKMMDYLTVLPTIPNPRSFGYEKLIGKEWGMLGNDSYGDCVWAGSAHETMLWNKMAGKTVEFDDDSVLADYSAVTGFNWWDATSDNGTNMRDAMNYRRKTGVMDAQGERHKIGAYVSIEPGNWDHLKIALYLFGAVPMGFQFPQSAMDQFNAKKTWKVVEGSQIEGGHYVPLVSYRTRLVCVTWGRPQPLSKGFFQTYCDEAYVALSEEMLTEGKSPEGFDVNALLHDLGQL